MRYFTVLLIPVLFISCAAPPPAVHPVQPEPVAESAPPTRVTTPTPLTKAQLLEKRKAYITLWERAMLGRGHDFYFTLTGKNKDELRVKYVLIDRPFVYQFQRDYADLIREMGTLGFRKIHLTDGYESEWTINIEPPPSL